MCALCRVIKKRMVCEECYGYMRHNAHFKWPAKIQIEEFEQKKNTNNYQAKKLHNRLWLSS